MFEEEKKEVFRIEKRIFISLSVQILYDEAISTAHFILISIQILQILIICMNLFINQIKSKRIQIQTNIYAMQSRHIKVQKSMI